MGGFEYDAARQWADRCLVHDTSLFKPERTVWTADHLADLARRLVDPKVPGTFDDKLRLQLADASSDVVLLAAETIFIHYLVMSDFKPATKRNVVNGVLALPPLSGGVRIPTDLDTALEGGVLRPGTFFHVHMDQQVRYIVELGRAVKGMPVDRREEAVGDADAFERIAYSVQSPGADGQRNAVLHLMFPSDFEPIVSQRNKQEIVERFRSLVSDPKASLDGQLRQIRRGLNLEYGSSFKFFDPNVKPLWSGEWKAWDRFIGWAERFWMKEDFDERERDYKLRIAAKLHLARELFAAGDEQWAAALAAAFGAPNNLTSWRVHQPVLKVLSGAPDEMRAALTAVWAESRPAEAIDRFGAALPRDVGGSRGQVASLGSFLRMALGAEQNPILQIETYRGGYKLTNQPMPTSDMTAGQVYQQGLEFLATLTDECTARGIKLRDPLDAQSLLWCVVRWPETEEPVRSWTQADKESFANFRKGVEPPPDDAAEDESGPADRGQLQLIGALGEYTGEAFEDHRALLKQTGKAASWWSFRIRPEFRDLLETPFTLNMYRRGNTIPARANVVAWETSTDASGIPCPWPEFALPGEAEGTSIGPHQSERFRTWLLFDGIEDLPHPLTLQDFRVAGTGAAPVAQQMLNSFLYVEPAEPQIVRPAGPERASPQATPWEIVAETAYLDVSFVKEIAALLGGRHQIVFQGPPGTGKTFLAKLVADAFAGESGGRVEIVQFHPSYGYEDFIEGLRPVVRDGALQYEIVPGALRRLATEAAAHPDQRFVLIIDEMNRGNLPKVFGELYFLLEYRNERARLAYSQEMFGLPDNLYVVGTMNTADRSIALVDFALRRRFAFIGFYPTSDQAQLRAYLTSNGKAELMYVADMLSAVNSAVANRDYALGHSYFMPQDPTSLTDASVESTWRYSIEPYLEEFWYEDQSRVESFRFATLRAKAGSQSPPSTEEPLASDD